VERDRFLEAAAASVKTRREQSDLRERGQGGPSKAATRVLHLLEAKLTDALARQQTATLAWLGNHSRRKLVAAKPPPRWQQLAELQLLQYDPAFAARITILTALSAAQHVNTTDNNSLTSTNALNNGSASSTHGTLPYLDMSQPSATSSSVHDSTLSLYQYDVVGAAPLVAVTGALSEALRRHLALQRAENLMASTSSMGHHGLSSASPDKSSSGDAMTRRQRGLLRAILASGNSFLVDRQLQNFVKSVALPEADVIHRGTALLLVDLLLENCHVDNTHAFWRIPENAGATEGVADEGEATCVAPTATTPTTTAPLFRRELVRSSPLKTMGYLVLDPEFTAWLSRQPFECLDNIAPSRPMLVPPVPWGGFFVGGYLHLQHALIKPSKKAGSTVQLQAFKDLDNKLREAKFIACDVLRLQNAESSMSTADNPPTLSFQSSLTRTLSSLHLDNFRPNHAAPVFAALTVLGATPWRVNRRVYCVMEHVWEHSGGGVLKLPFRTDKLAWRHALDVKKWAPEDARRFVHNQHSERAMFELVFGTARTLRSERCFFNPHNLDFRGRAYPLHPYLQHMSGDPVRALIEFAVAKPLGRHGLYWLRVHAANAYAVGGVDKLPLDERDAFIASRWDSHWAKDVANPYRVDALWREAEQPWQFFAAISEIHAALTCADGPEAYESTLPVHQDGSCNGLQHFAALGRDRRGGEAVNLTPPPGWDNHHDNNEQHSVVTRPGPQDVYTTVANYLAQRVRHDASKGHLIAHTLLGEVDRKLVKQTVMTTVYGVTHLGAQEQCFSRLVERGWNANDPKTKAAAKYAAQQTLHAVGDTFTQPKAIMKWLADAASVRAKSSPVTWRTPLGLPITQPYVRTRKIRLKHLTLRVDDIDVRSGRRTVQQGKQRSAMSPNYVHSLDSSHMMLTALACFEHGLVFAGVHDSYWTHATDVPTMSRILREKFVELHELPLLHDLRTQLEGGNHGSPGRRVPALTIDAPPETEADNKLDLQLVKKSPYFFS
jgi:hypothetical protein